MRHVLADVTFPLVKFSEGEIEPFKSLMKGKHATSNGSDDAYFPPFQPLKVIVSGQGFVALLGTFGGLMTGRPLLVIALASH
jgi:hypothetical protein